MTTDKSNKTGIAAQNKDTSNKTEIEDQSSIASNLVDVIFETISKKLSAQSKINENDRFFFPHGIGHISISIKQGQNDKLPDMQITLSESEQNSNKEKGS